MSHDDPQAEALRRRRTARHLGLSVGAVVLFAMALGGLYWGFGHRNDPPEPGPTPSPSPSAPAMQPTLLVQVTTPDGAVGNLLTAVIDGPLARASFIELPDTLVVASRDSPPQPLRRTVFGIDTLRPVRAVAETLGVRVDAAWRMDRKALAGLVDAVGGVTVDVPARLILRDSAGDVVLRLPAGEQTLSGTAASWYAVGDAKGQDAGEVVSRFTRVLAATIGDLPRDEPSIREALTALGALSPSTIATADLSAYIYDLATSLTAGTAERRVLPVAAAGSTRATPVWTDYNRATPLLRQMFSRAQWTAGRDGPPRVLVQAADQPPGLILSARAPIQSIGYIWVDGRGAALVPRADSTVQVRSQPVWGGEVAGVLGLSAESVIPASGSGPVIRGRPWADVDVRLGRDYRPS